MRNGEIFRAGRLALFLAPLAGCQGPSDEPPAGRALEAPPAVTQSPTFDVGSVVRQVHFSYRPEGDGFTGGDRAYAVRVDAEGRFAMQPVDRRPPPGSDDDAMVTRRARNLARPAIHGAVATFSTVQVTNDASPPGRPAETRVDVDGSLTIDRGGAIERLRNTEEGVEQTWSYAQRPESKGDLTIRVAISGEDYAGTTPEGLHFLDLETGIGLRYGVATWVDARGERTSIMPRFERGEIVITVPAAVVARSVFPALLDPLLTPETGMGSPLTSKGGNSQERPAIGFADGFFQVVWSDERSRFASNVVGDIIGTRVMQNGVVLDPTGINYAAVPDAQETDPAISCSASDCLVVWEDSRTVGGAEQHTIYGKMISGGSPVQIISTEAYDPAVGWNGTRYLVAWEDYAADPAGDLYARRVSSTGTVTGNPILIRSTSAAQGNPAVAGDVDHNDFLVVFQDDTYGTIGVRGRRVEDSGSTPSSSYQINDAANDQIDPAVAYDPTFGVFLVAWSDGRTSTIARDIYTTLITAADDTVVQPNGVALAVEAGHQSRPVISQHGYYLFVAWDDSRSGTYEVYGRSVFAESGGPVGPAGGTKISNGGARYPAVVSGGDLLAGVVFQSSKEGFGERTFLARVSVNNVSVADPNGIKCSTGQNEQISPDVAFDGTNYFVAWADDRSIDSQGRDIWGAKVNPSGTVLYSVSVCGFAGEQTLPRVAYVNGNYLVAWRDDRPTVNGVYGQRVRASDGALLNGAGGFAVAAYGQTLDEPRIAAGTGSTALVVWEDLSDGIHGSLVNGATPGPLFTVVDTGNTHTAPAIAFNGSRYLVAWQDSRNSDVYVMRLDTAATLLDPAGGIVVSTGTSIQSRPAVSSNGSAFLVSWNDRTSPGDLYSVRACSVPGSGSPGASFTVSSTANTVSKTYVQSSWDGVNYLVGWMVPTPVESIFARRVSPAGSVLDGSDLAIATSTPLYSAGFGMASNGQGRTLVAFSKLDPASGNTLRIKGTFLLSIATGQPCYNNSSSSCASGFCVTGVCCSTSSCGVSHGSGTCAATPGTCTIASCSANYADCDGLYGTGCEVSLLTDPDHCGACSNAVCDGTHAIQRGCSNGVCSYACSAGWGDCLTAPPNYNGCETSLTTLPNCGSCGQACDDSITCTTDGCFNSACTHVNPSRCATPHAATLPLPLGSSCISSSCAIADTDGDGLNDDWETAGYIDINCNGLNDGPTLDLPLPGANPAVKDLYFEYDYMAGAHSHKPAAAAVQAVVDALALRNVVVHIDPTQTDAIPETSVVTFDPVDPICSGAGAANFYNLKATYSDAKRKLAYHYAIFGHYNTCGSPDSCSLCSPSVAFGSGGKAELPGNDFIVSTGPIFDAGVVPTVQNDAALLLHELGHNLSLRHAGESDLPEFKPNLMSVINNNFVYTGIPVAATSGSPSAKVCLVGADCPTGSICREDACCLTGTVTNAPGTCCDSDSLTPLPACGAACTPDKTCARIDYSGAALASLDENGLNEGAGISAGTNDITLYNCPLAVDPINPSRPGPATGAIDWNCNGDTSEPNVTADLNLDGSQSTLTGFDDWAATAWEFQCTPGGSANAAPPPGNTSDNELSFSQAQSQHILYPRKAVPTDPRPGCSNNWIQLGGGLSATSVIDYAGGSCLVCGGGYATITDDTRTFADPTPANSLVTQVKVDLRGGNCSAFFGVMVKINGVLIGTPNPSLACNCGTCQTFPSVTLTNPAGIPGWIYGGTNSLRLTTIFGDVIIHDATITATYGRVPVRINGSATFDVSQIETATLRFGGAPAVYTTIAESNGDNYLDMTALFDMPGMAFAATATSGVVTGSFTNSQAFWGKHTVLITGSQQACIP